MNLHAIELPQLRGQRRVDGVEAPRHRADEVRGATSRRWRGSTQVASFESIMAVDKKVADGLLRLILLKGELGNCVFTGEYDRGVLKQTLEHFCDPENQSN